MTDFRPDEHQLRAVRKFCQGSTHDRFWSKVDKSDECWVWTAGCWESGYGKFKIWHEGKWRSIRAHRYSCDALDDPRMVLHRCHNRRCVRPDHLYFGGQQENMDDMVAAGRSVRGAKNVNTKITEAQALEIKQRLAFGEKLIDIARAMNVPYRPVAHIKYGTAWKYIS